MSKSLKNLIVLYVEDDKFMRTLMKKALENIVKEVYVAENGEQGLELYKKVAPDIVLTDRYMPKMNGLEMARLIKEINPKQPIGLFTGDIENNTEMHKKELNIDLYITKPLERKTFYNTLTYLNQLA